MIECKKCGMKETLQEKYEPHHLIPKCIGGTDKDGRRYLCKKHHNIIHKILLKIMWGYIPLEKQEKVKEKIREFSINWMNQKKR